MASSGLWENGILTKKTLTTEGTSMCPTDTKREGIWPPRVVGRMILTNAMNLCICNKIRIRVHFKGNNTIHKLLLALKDKDTII